MTRISLMIFPVLPTISKSSNPSSSSDRKKGISAKKSIRFISWKKNLIFLGQVIRRMTYSTRKKETTMYSTMSMVKMTYSRTS